jgi:hypothetical protein
MDASEQQAEALARVSGAILDAIDQAGGAGDMVVTMGSLGAAIGAIAQATGHPEECLDMVMKIARGIIRGSLLED